MGKGQLLGIFGFGQPVCKAKIPYFVQRSCQRLMILAPECGIVGFRCSTLYAIWTMLTEKTTFTYLRRRLADTFQKKKSRKRYSVLS